MTQKITPQLMFTGQAELAMQTYVALFSNAEIVSLEKYADGEPGKMGSVKFAVFALGDQHFNCIDSPAQHDFDFTPSFSIFVDCESDAELESLYQGLSEGGSILMPIGDYGFSRRFGWINDRFGVSWQLNLN